MGLVKEQSAEFEVCRRFDRVTRGSQGMLAAVQHTS